MKTNPAFHPARFQAFVRLLLFAPPILVGLCLRLYGLCGQILLDDEWHSLNFVLDKSFLEVLTRHGLGANCIPQNAINWIWLHTVGWSEAVLVFPSVLCGAAGLVLFPWLVSRLAGRTVAFFFSWLLAVSPAAIFYARIVRPYSMVLFFGFLAFLCLALWTREGRPRLLFAYALSGFLSIYFHLYAALPVLAPLGALFILAALRRKVRNAEAPWISMKNAIWPGLLMAALLALFLGPAHLRNPWWMCLINNGNDAGFGLWKFLSLLSGTHLLVGELAFAALVGYGLCAWLRIEFRIGLLFLSVWGAFCIFRIFAPPEGMHAAIQIARYNIVLFPVSMLLGSFALEHLLARYLPAVPDRWRMLLGLLPIGGLLVGSPLRQTYASPNNFTHHSAFQDSYAPFDWSRSRLYALSPLPQMEAARIPAFYSGWATNSSVHGIVEYPMYIGDPLNFHYFYQHFHRKPVAIGYVPDFPFPPLPSRNDCVYRITPVDYVFNRVQSLGLAGSMRFANLVPITDTRRLRQTHRGWLLVVHRDLLAETMGVRDNAANFRPSAMLDLFLCAGLGAPTFSDAQIAAWRIP